ncbi:MAG: glycoside hydrolase family 18 protein [Eubacterium sp.]|nr:glycoside hydrolase family 18 protein [Eubacterium sp.]
MKFVKKIGNVFHSRGCSYLFFVLSVCAAIFLRGAEWAYSWIAQLYPLGDKFIPVMFAVIGVCIAVNFGYLLLTAFANEKKDSIKGIKAINIMHTVFAVLGTITFIYSFVLIFGLDSGASAAKFTNGLNGILPYLIYLALACAIAQLVFCDSKKKVISSLISSVVVCAMIVTMVNFPNVSGGSNESSTFPPVTFESENLAEGAVITFESLKQGEKPDAENMLADNNNCWTAQSPNRLPAEGFDDTNNSVAEIKLAQVTTFNTAVIEEVGNEAQYFRLQALVNDEWVTIYQSEKIQDMRLCSFDAVTTDCIRLSIDKFRDDSTPVKIRSIKLYNEPMRNADDFEVTVYQRLDGDVPTEILAKGDEYVKNYARFYDVYSTVIVFAAVHWDENGQMNFGEMGEEKFAQEIAALKEIIANRSNPDHKVKLIVTALADGAWGNGHNGVNTYMASYWEDVANQIAAFAAKYDFDGVDIDWEYPASADDWKNYDSFIQKLSKDLKAVKPESIISTALSAGQLGLSQETFDCIDQIQFMAYDGNDTDGYQSSLQQAEEGMRDFVANGADISKINIGIAAYGRPVNGSPYWATWRDLEDANYWNSKYFTVPDANQIYEGTFCSPALAGDKTAYALLSGAGGVMVFRVGCDKTMDNPNSVACGIENTLHRYINNW